MGNRQTSIFEARIEGGRGWIRRKGRWFDTMSMARVSFNRHRGDYSFQCRDVVLPPTSVSPVLDFVGLSRFVDVVRRSARADVRPSHANRYR